MKLIELSVEDYDKTNILEIITELEGTHVITGMKGIEKLNKELLDVGYTLDKSRSLSIIDIFMDMTANYIKEDKLFKITHLPFWDLLANSILIDFTPIQAYNIIILKENDLVGYLKLKNES